MKYIPYQYQKDCIEFLDQNKKAALFLDMGLGKTSIVLTHVYNLQLDSFQSRHALIVAPLRVATVTWPMEIEKWDHTRSLSYHVLHGKGRRVDIPRTNITLTNYETLPWLVKYPHLFSRFDYVVFDESTMIKNASSKRWKLAFRMFGACDRITLLTGTPVPNGLEDIWAQVFFLDHGARLGRTKSTFMQTYFMQGGYMNYKYFPLAGARDRIVNKIGDVAKTMKAEDYVQLPKLMLNDITVKLPAKAQVLYDKMEREFFVDLGTAEILAFNAASQSAKLRQCVQGFMYDSETKAHQIHTAKVKALEELIISNPAENFLVAVNFVHEIEMLCRTFAGSRAVYGKTSAKDSSDIITDWNAGNLKLLFAHPASLGHGLNLQSGGRIIVWMGPTWNLEHWHQFNARLHRHGQTKPVIVHTLVADKTIDTVVSQTLRGKDASQETLLRGLVAYQRSKTRITMEDVI
jgi:SNF2 family DNA or RNA helicase